MSSKAAKLVREADAMPNGWRAVVLSDVADVNPETLRASTPPDFAFGYIDISQIDDPGQCTGWTAQTFGDAPSRARRKVQAEDILVSTVRPYLRSFAQVPRAALPLIASTGFAVIRARGAADQQFLYQHILHSSFIDHLTPRMTGSNYPAVSAKDVEAYPILLPPLDEQRRVAQVLRSLDKAITAAQAVYEAAISAQASAFETFLQSGNDVQGSTPITGWTTGEIRGVRRLPAGWRTVKLVEVARLESGHTPNRTKPEYWDGGDVEWISLHDTQNLERCDISQTDLRITQAGLANSSARLLPPGTVCFSRTATVGKCVIMAKSMATSQDFANFVCSPALNNRYLLHLMRWMQPVWKALASGSTHQTIYMPTFKALQIILPPRAQQDSIAATMDSFVSVAEVNAAAITRLRSMKAAITSDLLSGRVRVLEQISAPIETVPASFKRAVFAAEVVHQLHNDNRFGAVKHEKIVHLCELHLDLHNELDRHAYKKAAGPYDPLARHSVEKILQQQKWFATAKLDGKRVVYSSLENVGDHTVYFDQYFGKKKASIQAIIDLLRPLDTERCEMIATAYAVWNDFLIDGHKPLDAEIVASILQWHPRKARISGERWSAVLPWMRQQGLVPRGTGEKTRTGST